MKVNKIDIANWSLIGIAVLVFCVMIVAIVFGLATKPTTLDQQRQDFVDGCKYYAGGAPDTSTSPWRCVKP